MATAEEIEAAARQYVRKVSGVQAVSAASQLAFDLAVLRVTQATTELLETLPKPFAILKILLNRDTYYPSSTWVTCITPAIKQLNQAA